MQFWLSRPLPRWISPKSSMNRQLPEFVQVECEPRRHRIPAERHGDRFGGLPKTGMTSVTVLKDISYGSNAFDSCASLVSVTVEEGVTEIGNYMFQNTKLTSVTLPNSVTKIGASAFNGCSLTTINFGQGVKTIENSAFQNCGELTEIILPDATETLGQNAFGDCPNWLRFVRQEYENTRSILFRRLLERLPLAG